MCVWGGVTCVVCVLIYCKRWKPGMRKRWRVEQADRQAVWWSVSSPWTPPWCEIDVSRNKMPFFKWIGRWLSLSLQSGGLRGTTLLWQAFTVRAERGRCPANSSGNLLKSFEGKWIVLLAVGVWNRETLERQTVVWSEIQNVLVKVSTESYSDAFQTNTNSQMFYLTLIQPHWVLFILANATPHFLASVRKTQRCEK